MATCILCGSEIGFLGQFVVHLYSTEQPVCKQCSRQYEQADALEKNRLRDRMLTSPNLKKRERVMESLSEERTNRELRDRERMEEKQKLDALTARMKTALRCCDTSMTCLGRGRYTQFTANLLPPMLERPVIVFECPVCGQVKFFNPDFVPASMREKEDRDG